jgi:prevent-host-death family protein
MIHTKAEQTVSVAEFREKIDHYLAAARDGGGPIVIMDGDKVVGVLVAAEDYDQMYGAAIGQLLRDRLREKETISHEEAMAQFRAAVQRRAKRP